MKKKILTYLIVLIIVIVAVTGATILFDFPYSPYNPPQTDDSGFTLSGIEQVVNANNQFAFDLYSQIDKENENIFYSPYSISAALAMTYEGAKGETRDEMKEVFHFPEDEILRTNFAAIYNKINNNNDAYQLRTGNALWTQYDFSFLENYTSRVEKYYGGKATNLDFAGETEKSRQTINSFIEEQTNNKIVDLIPEGVLSSNTKLVLTNAIYFKGTWEWEFDKSDTREMDFKISPDNIVKTDMMYMKPEKATFSYAQTDDLQILELPYKGGDISMLILLPTEDLNNLDLDLENLNDWKSEMKETALDHIYIPKFEFDTKYFMVETLSEMGMPTAFSGGADFSGMNGQRNLRISEVIHQAYVKVDEKGTEAAAATAVIMDKMSAGPMEPKIFKADHPFVFIIQEKETGNILFLGKVADPTK